MSADQRLETIEIKLAHLESLLQELGRTVMQQQRQIDLLLEGNRVLKAQLESMEGSADGGGFEIPPHY